MKPCKRIEIIIEQPIASRVQKRLDDIGVSGYTMLPGASGRGDRGTRREDDPTGTFTNCVFIVACDDDDEAERVVAGIRPLIARSGGVCLVTDAYWVKH
ncbi:MAG: P-II family nitrogen regulator [Pseudomonadota bacterium]